MEGKHTTNTLFFCTSQTQNRNRDFKNSLEKKAKCEFSQKNVQQGWCGGSPRYEFIFELKY